MAHFPERLSLPKKVTAARRARNKQLIRSALQGSAIRGIIIVAEVIGVLYFGSASLFMDAVASTIDVLFTFLLIACIKIADRPPDREHPFGHGRYEPIFGLQISLILALVGFAATIQQILHLFEPIQKTSFAGPVWLIPFAAVVLLEICYRIVMRAAKQQDSPAVSADAIHYRIDSLTSAIATIALLIATYSPSYSDVFDHLGAVIISLIMIGLGFFAAKKNLNQLLDRTPQQQYFDRVREASKKVEGVLGTEKILIQQYGPDAHVDIDIEVNPKLSVERAHEISQRVRLEIQREWPNVRDVTVHIEPFYPNDH